MEALRFAALGWSRVRFTGPEAKKFLHGQLTPDVLSMKKGDCRPACLLTPKGRLRGVFDLFDLGEEVLAVGNAPSIANLKEDLGKRIMLADAQMVEIVGPLWYGLSPELFQGRFFPQGGWGTQGEPGGMGFEDWLTRQGVPVYGRDLGEDTLPQEAGLDEALSFTKGCYMGQETISRLHHLGHVNRKLAALKLDGEPSADVKLTSRSGDRALGWLKVDKAAPGTRLGGAVVL